MFTQIFKYSQFMRTRSSVLHAMGAFAAFVVTIPAQAAPVASDFIAVPPVLGQADEPLVMLTMSNDHQLYFKAYTDFDDLDEDGLIDTTYKNEIEYYGYFDSDKCYVYKSEGLFVPDTAAENHYCTGQWSGNFLNWATMTRMDVVRKVLYGGSRSVDEVNNTVLERTYLPNDAHSFAKYYNGTDANRLMPSELVGGDFGDASSSSGVTFCNTTDVSSGESTDSAVIATPPTVKVVPGNYSLWAAGERFQCLYRDDSRVTGNRGENSNNPSNPNHVPFAYGESPHSSEEVGNYVVRVQACVSGLIGSEKCKEYEDSDGNISLKPIGVLQQHGDEGGTLFGLLTGSYEKNKSGGVLRKNISNIADDEVDTSTGVFTTMVQNGEGIIGTLSAFRINGYDHSDGRYNATDDCPWGIGSFSNGDCTNWGNPFTEILLESYRYFAGESPNSAFSVGSSDAGVPGLQEEAWVDPLSDFSKYACSRLTTVALNASSNSYDHDNNDNNDLSGVVDLGITDLVGLTNAVGENEGINGNEFFVGKTENSNDGLCTAKSITGLGNVSGTCPESPRLDGSYLMAGLAHHVHTNDLRTAAGEDGDQTIDTFAVSLAGTLPQVTVQSPDESRSVTFLPACQNTSVDVGSGDGEGGRCGLVDFKQILPPTLTSVDSSHDLGEYFTAGTKIRMGKVYVNWEDSEQGGDFDQDVIGTITYFMSNTSIVMRTDAIGESTDQELGLGYVIAGVDNSGWHVHSGIEGFNKGSCSGGCEVDDPASDAEYILGGQDAEVLQPALYYAAKYGYFNESDSLGDAEYGWPQAADGSNNEWDRKNLSGLYTPDGIPDNYFPVRNPAELAGSLSSVLAVITERTTSGTSAAVVANSSTGVGAIYQAYYVPSYEDENGNSMKWGGVLHSLFLDEFGRLRADDGAAARELDDDDNVVTMCYDPDAQETKFTLTGPGEAAPDRSKCLNDGEPLADVPSIWNARDKLAADEITASIESNRPDFASGAQAGRYIFTWLDEDGNGLAPKDGSEPLVPFEADNFAPASDNTRYLGLADTTWSQDLVNYIRGKEVPGFRNRSVLLPGADYETRKPWRLGDIVHSSPVSVGPPNAYYDILFEDETYAAFKEQYANRRQVVYVGANDGMLHAFNAGEWDADNQAFLERDHDLGSELWAYVPKNLLPHLQWLADPEYQHTYYVDGAIRAFDVRAFEPSTTHPGGWGTVLVAAMRLGGGDFPVDLNGDGNAETTMRSAYMFFDITDPEQPPELLAEIDAYVDETDGSEPYVYGFTTSAPALVRRNVADSNGDYGTGDYFWGIVFGTGPTDLVTVTSDQAPKIFAFDIFQRSVIPVHTPADDSAPHGFYGDFSSVDWDDNYIDDTVYVGTVEGNEEVSGGRLHRLTLDESGSSLGLGGSDSLSTMIVTNQPVTSTPATAKNNSTGDRMVMFGTGRFYTSDDADNDEQQAFYGIKEAGDESTVDKGELVETSGTSIQLDGDVSGSGTGATSFNDLRAEMADEKGWYFEFPNASSRGTERNLSRAALAPPSVLFTTYVPKGDSCDPGGESYLYALNMTTGTASPFAPLGPQPSGENGNDVADPSIKLGEGLYSAPMLLPSTGDKSILNPSGDGNGGDGDGDGDGGDDGGSTDPGDIRAGDAYCGDAASLGQDVLFQNEFSEIGSSTVGTGLVGCGRKSWRMIDIPF